MAFDIWLLFALKCFFKARILLKATQNSLVAATLKSLTQVRCCISFCFRSITRILSSIMLHPISKPKDTFIACYNATDNGQYCPNIGDFIFLSVEKSRQQARRRKMCYDHSRLLLSKIFCFWVRSMFLINWDNITGVFLSSQQSLPTILTLTPTGCVSFPSHPRL